MTSLLAAEPLFRTTGWVPSTPNALEPSVAHLTTSLAKRFGDDQPRLDDISVVFRELLSRAMEASTHSSEVRYSYAYDGTAIELRVVAETSGATNVQLETEPDTSSEAGLTLTLTSQYSDRVEFHSDHSQVDISAHFVL